MPCRDYPVDQPVWYEDTSKVDKLTRMLCATLGYLDSGRVDRCHLRALPKEVLSWREEHQEQDRRRTAEERKALGI